MNSISRLKYFRIFIWLKIRSTIVVRGLRKKDRVKLLIWLLLDSCPKIIERRLHFTRILSIVKDRLIKGTFVRVGGLYKLVDSASALVISPEFENSYGSTLTLRKVMYL